MIISNNHISNSNSILENATYLYESEMPNVSAYSIPVVANDRFNAGIVSYEDLNRLCENTGIELIDAIRAVSEANNLNPNDVVVSINESTIILDPWVIDEVHQYVVAPVSESNIACQYTDMMVNAFLETGDDYYLQAISEAPIDDIEKEIDDMETDNKEMNKKFLTNLSHSERKALRTAGGKALSYAYGSGLSFKDKDGKTQKLSFNDGNWLVRLKRFLTDKPRTFLANCVSRLRETYRKFLEKANKENDSGKIKWYKQIARKILQAVDWILRKIEGFATINYASRIKKIGKHAVGTLKDNQDNLIHAIDNNPGSIKFTGKLGKLNGVNVDDLVNLSPEKMSGIAKKAGFDVDTLDRINSKLQ